MGKTIILLGEWLTLKEHCSEITFIKELRWSNKKHTVLLTLSSPWYPLIPHPAFANVHQVRLVCPLTRRGENWLSLCVCRNAVLQSDSNQRVSAGVAAETAFYHTDSWTKEWECYMEDHWGLNLFLVGVLTIHVQNTAHRLFLRLGHWSVGSLVEITQVMPPGRSQIHLIHWVLQHCSNVLHIYQFPAETKHIRRAG
jgi:hypothetical protein